MDNIFRILTYVICNPVNIWVQIFLTNQVQMVVCEGEMSSWEPVNSRLPQGLGFLNIDIFLNYIFVNLFGLKWLYSSTWLVLFTSHILAKHGWYSVTKMRQIDYWIYCEITCSYTMASSFNIFKIIVKSHKILSSQS